MRRESNPPPPDAADPPVPRVTHDLHCHTHISTCATRECTLELLVERAAGAGLSLLGVTDHINDGNAQRLADIHRLAERVRSRAWPVEVRVGAEVSLLRPGRLAVAPEQVAGLDFFIISPNHYGVPGVEGPRAWTPAGVAAWVLEGAAAAVEARPLAVSHPFFHGWVGFVPPELVFASLDRERLRGLFERAGELRVALELNARKVCAAPAFFGELIALAGGTGVRFSLCSDAHAPNEMAYGGPEGREQYERLLTQLGLTPDLVWTAPWWAERASGSL